MKNFIFKSKDFGLTKNVSMKLETIQSELRHQRVDHIEFIRLINKLFLELNLQKQANDYYEAHGGEVETSHQTDLDEQTSEQI